jgi:hypothetical protein
LDQSGRGSAHRDDHQRAPVDQFTDALQGAVVHIYVHGFGDVLVLLRGPPGYAGSGGGESRTGSAFDDERLLRETVFDRCSASADVSEFKRGRGRCSSQRAGYEPLRSRSDADDRFHHGPFHVVAGVLGAAAVGVLGPFSDVS